MNIYLYIAIFLMLILAALIFGFVLGAHVRKKETGWKDAAKENPPEFIGLIQNYPVALYAPDFGVIVDQAEWHPKARRWLSVPYGDPVAPFAWFDLPPAPWPDLQDIASHDPVDTYI